MKRMNRILLFVLCLALAGLVALRIWHDAPDTPLLPPAQVQTSPTPGPTAASTPAHTPEPAPDPVSVSTPEPAPVSRIVLEAGEEIDRPCGLPFEDPGFTAYGRDGGDLSAEVTVTGEVVPWRPGDYTLTYTLADDGGVIDAVRRTVHVVPQKMKEAARPASGTICLTYIDTPCECTEELLSLLKRDNVKATFFVSTYPESFLDLLTKIAEDGHEIGIYFPNMSWYGGEDGVLEHSLSEIVKTQEIIFEKTGRYAKFIRFNGGTTNAGYLAACFPGDFPELMETMHEMGLLVFDWNLEVDVAEVTAKISSNFTHPSDPYDYVVAMQQNFRRQSVLAVPEMIRWGKEKGYTFSLLEDTFPEVLIGQEEEEPPSPKPDAATPKPAATSPQPAVVSPPSAIVSPEPALPSSLPEFSLPEIVFPSLEPVFPSL